MKCRSILGVTWFNERSVMASFNTADYRMGAFPTASMYGKLLLVAKWAEATSDLILQEFPICKTSCQLGNISMFHDEFFQFSHSTFFTPC